MPHDEDDEKSAERDPRKVAGEEAASEWIGWVVVGAWALGTLVYYAIIGW